MNTDTTSPALPDLADNSPNLRTSCGQTTGPTGPNGRWKRGDVREDGMVFWMYEYGTGRHANEWWATSEEFEQMLKEKRQRENEKEKLRHKRLMRENPEYRAKERERELRRVKRKMERDCDFAERIRARSRAGYRKAWSKNGTTKQKKIKFLSSDAGRKFKAQANLRYRLRNNLPGLNIQSVSDWIDTLVSRPRSWRLVESITSLEPPTGQTLAQLIHELSGYPMDVCEYIANPPEPEPTPEPEPIPEQPRESYEVF